MEEWNDGRMEEWKSGIDRREFTEGNDACLACA